MLILRRRKMESIRFSCEHGDVEVHVLAVEGQTVKIGINAPQEVSVMRLELLTQACNDCHHWETSCKALGVPLVQLGCSLTPSRFRAA